MATDTSGTGGTKGPDVLVSTVTALTASGAWVTWSGYRAASKTKGRPDYYISTLASTASDPTQPSSYDLVQIGAQAKSADVQLTIIALGAGATAQLTAPGGTVTPLTVGVMVTVPGSVPANGAYLLTFTGASCTLKVVRPTTTGEMTTLGDGDGEDPPPPYPGDDGAH